MKRMRRHGWFSWASVSLLAVLCAVVAVLQYRWIGGISEAERQRLQSQLQDRLNSFRRSFNDEILTACTALEPDAGLIERSGREAAYAYQYARWKESHGALFRRIGLAVPQPGGLAFYGMDLDSGRLTLGDWPAEWRSTHDRLAARMNRLPPGPRGAQDYMLLDMPRFGPDASGGVREEEWMILELDPGYIRGTLVPEMLGRYLGDYDAEIVVNQAPDVVIYPAGEAAKQRIGRSADASVTLLDNGGGGRGEPGGGGRGEPGGPPPGPGFRGRPPEKGFEGPGPRRGYGGPPLAPPPQRPMASGEAWRLSVRHKAGSLDMLVRQVRLRNLGISGGLLLLIVATAAMLVRFSRQAQRLAGMQMDFVAGVSHELRTPLTVIRTAAFNLRGKMAHMPEQVERYGGLIQEQTEKLEALVEQVLSFARTNAGAVIREKEPVRVEELIERSLDSCRAGIEKAGVALEKHVAPDLPWIPADELAMRQALQNLIENALKYGTEGSHWIGIFASAVDCGQVEIRVADRGPGIPRDEQARIFDPFFRGRRAVRDQVHGTGLGLDIVKKIVEAHGGSIRVRSEPGKLTEFVVRVPAAEPGAGADKER